LRTPQEIPEPERVKDDDRPRANWILAGDPRRKGIEMNKPSEELKRLEAAADTAWAAADTARAAADTARDAYQKARDAYTRAARAAYDKERP